MRPSAINEPIEPSPLNSDNDLPSQPALAQPATFERDYLNCEDTYQEIIHALLTILDQSHIQIDNKNLHTDYLHWLGKCIHAKKIEIEKENKQKKITAFTSALKQQFNQSIFYSHLYNLFITYFIRLAQAWPNLVFQLINELNDSESNAYAHNGKTNKSKNTFLVLLEIYTEYLNSVHSPRLNTALNSYTKFKQEYNTFHNNVYDRLSSERATNPESQKLSTLLCAAIIATCRCYTEMKSSSLFFNPSITEQERNHILEKFDGWISDVKLERDGVKVTPSESLSQLSLHHAAQILAIAINPLLHNWESNHLSISDGIFGSFNFTCCNSSYANKSEILLSHLGTIKAKMNAQSEQLSIEEHKIIKKMGRIKVEGVEPVVKICGAVNVTQATITDIADFNPLFKTQFIRPLYETLKKSFSEESWCQEYRERASMIIFDKYKPHLVDDYAIRSSAVTDIANHNQHLMNFKVRLLQSQTIAHVDDTVKAIIDYIRQCYNDDTTFFIAHTLQIAINDPSIVGERMRVSPSTFCDAIAEEIDIYKPKLGNESQFNFGRWLDQYSKAKVPNGLNSLNALEEMDLIAYFHRQHSLPLPSSVEPLLKQARCDEKLN